MWCLLINTCFALELVMAECWLEIGQVNAYNEPEIGVEILHLHLVLLSANNFLWQQVHYCGYPLHPDCKFIRKSVDSVCSEAVFIQIRGLFLKG